MYSINLLLIYKKDAFAGFFSQVFEKNNWPKYFVTFSRFWQLRDWRVGWKKEKLWQKSFSGNVEWSCKSMIPADIKINVK